jgi:hypothetical protein
MRFTYAYITYKKDVFDQHLGPCLEKIKDNVDIITKSNIRPSKFHNQIIDESPNRFIIFSHEDVTFSKDIIKQIQITIEKTPNFGVLCVVGKNKDNKNIGALASNQYELEFCDPCFFVVDKENPLRFDEKTFDDFHFGVEDYCIGSKEIHNRGTYSILINWGKEENHTELNDSPKVFKHHSYTCRTVRYQWGAYAEYKKRFKNKWGKLPNIKNF